MLVFFVRWRFDMMMLWFVVCDGGIIWEFIGDGVFRCGWSGCNCCWCGGDRSIGVVFGVVLIFSDGRGVFKIVEVKVVI